MGTDVLTVPPYPGIPAIVDGSEAVATAEGAALAGGRVTNFTAGQGLVLMKEVLFVIAGKRLPVVSHVGPGWPSSPTPTTSSTM